MTMTAPTKVVVISDKERARLLARTVETVTMNAEKLAPAFAELRRARQYRRRQDEIRERWYAGSLPSLAPVGPIEGLAEAYRVHGVIHRECGDVALSELHFELALSVAGEGGCHLLTSEIHHELATLYEMGERFREAIRSLNAAYAAAPAEAVEQRELLEASYGEVLAGWGAQTIETCDPYTQHHSMRVAEYAAEIAARIGRSPKACAWIRVGALLHDVGKTVLPMELLLKPGPLDAAEWAVMQQHPALGAAIVEQLELPYPVSAMVRSHHERWDGSGYPDGIAGEDIPLDARILAVADVFDALTSTRSYRPAFDTKTALRMLAQESGKLLDPELLAVFCAEVAPTAEGRHAA